MADPAAYQFNLPQRGRPSDVILNEVWYLGIQAYWETSTSSRLARQEFLFAPEH